MKSILVILSVAFLILSCSSEEKKSEDKEKQDEQASTQDDVKKPYEELKAKVFYEGIKKIGTNKLYKFRVDSIGTDKITMLGVSLFGEEEEVSGLAMSANSDSALVYTVGDKLVIELFDGVANFFDENQMIKTESFIKKEYRFDIKDIEITKKHPPKKKNNGK